MIFSALALSGFVYVFSVFPLCPCHIISHNHSLKVPSKASRMHTELPHTTSHIIEGRGQHSSYYRKSRRSSLPHIVEAHSCRRPSMLCRVNSYSITGLAVEDEVLELCIKHRFSRSCIDRFSFPEQPTILATKLSE